MPRAKASYGDRRMEIVGRGDNDRIHQAAVEQLLMRGEAGHAVFCRERVPRGRVDIADRRQLRFGDLAHHIAVSRPHAARADNAESHFSVCHSAATPLPQDFCYRSFRRARSVLRRQSCHERERV